MWRWRERGGAYGAGDCRVGARMADSVPVVRFRVGAGVWRAGVPGADTDAGGSRGHAECDRTEFDSVQHGGHDWSRAGGAGPGGAGGEVVVWAECGFVSGAYHFAVDDIGTIPASNYRRVDVQQPEAGHQV